jgi:hypothetical protein
MVLALLLLAAHLHPWEGSGLFLLLLFSIPIDIWALGLCARTVLIDRLKVDPQPGVGTTLWVRWAIFSALVLPIIMMVVGGVTDAAKSVVASIIESFKEHIYPTLPVAEQISLELVMWGSVASLALIVCMVGWLYGLGWLAQPVVKNAKAFDGTKEDQANFWDNLRIPADQPLLLTAFTGSGVVLVFIFWGIMPATTPHPHEEYEYTFEKKEEVAVEPKKVLKEAEQVLNKAELVVKKIQEEKNKNPEKSAEKIEAAKEPSTSKPPSDETKQEK